LRRLVIFDFESSEIDFKALQWRDRSMMNELMAGALRMFYSLELPQLIFSKFRELNVSLFATASDTNIRTHALNVDVSIEESGGIAYASDMFPMLGHRRIQDA
jgi:hypothetical protein